MGKEGGRRRDGWEGEDGAGGRTRRCGGAGLKHPSLHAESSQAVLRQAGSRQRRRQPVRMEFFS